MANKHPYQSVAQLEEEWFSNLERESDRGVALIVGEALNVALELLLKHVMANSCKNDLFGGTAPLATFDSRINMAFAFGLISADDSKDLHLVRKIRNDFAHSILAMTWDSPAVANRTRDFLMLKRVEAFESENPPGPFKHSILGSGTVRSLSAVINTPRLKFLYVTMLLMAGIRDRTEHVERLPTYEEWRETRPAMTEDMLLRGLLSRRSERA